jgi:Enoyl-CoA hydratase/isomerase
VIRDTVPAAYALTWSRGKNTKAAERRQRVAHGVSHGLEWQVQKSPAPEISLEMRRELCEAVGQVAESGARTFSFAAGATSVWAAMSASGPACSCGPAAQDRGVRKAIDQLGRLEIPTLAPVQAGCVGGGFELAMTCAMIFASRSAWFSCPEAASGHPESSGRHAVRRPAWPCSGRPSWSSSPSRFG